MSVPAESLAVGARITALRKQRGLTGRDLARIIGVSAASLSRIESQDPKRARGPRREIVHSIARALGVPPYFLEYGVSLGVYVLIRQDDTGGVETIAAFTDEVEADEWARTAEAAQVDEDGEPLRFPPNTYSVNYVPINDTETMALFAAERLSEPTDDFVVTEPKEATT